jgi:hypothetical protein
MQPRGFAWKQNHGWTLMLDRREPGNTAKDHPCYPCPSVVYQSSSHTRMNRLPNSRRRFFGVSLLAILVLLAVLWALRKVPPAERNGPATPEGKAN